MADRRSASRQAGPGPRGRGRGRAAAGPAPESVQNHNAALSILLEYLNPQMWPTAPELPSHVQEWLESTRAVLSQRIAEQVAGAFSEVARVLILQASAAHKNNADLNKACKNLLAQNAKLRSGKPDDEWRTKYVQLLLQYRALAERHGEPHNVAVLPAPEGAAAPAAAAPPPAPPPRRPNRKERRAQQQQKQRQKGGSK